MLRTFISTSVASTASGISGTGSNDQVTNTTTETCFTQYYPLTYTGYPVSALDGTTNQFGAAVKVTAYGYISTAAVPGTLTLNARYGVKPNLITGSLIGTTGAFTPPISLSSAYFTYQGIAIFRTSEPTQTNTQGRFEGHIMIQNVSNVPFIQGIVNSGTGTAGFAAAFALNSASTAFQHSAQWSIASASNIITVSQICYEAITQEL